MHTNKAEGAKMIRLTTLGTLILLLVGCAQFRQSSDAENRYSYRMENAENPDILLQVSFSLDWIEDVFEWEMPFVKNDVGELQSTPQTLKVREHADGADFWCDSNAVFTHESPGSVRIMFSYAYSRSPDEIKNDGQIDFLIPFEKDGQSEEGEISCKWKWIEVEKAGL